MDKRSRKGNLFIIVFYLCVTSGKVSSTEEWSTSSQITTTSVSDTTTQLTQTTANYTAPDATNTGITTTGTSAGDPATSSPTGDNTTQAETITTVTSTTTNANITKSNNVTSTPGNNMTSTLGNNMTSTLDTVTSTKTNTNSETSTMSNSLTSTPGGNTTSTLGTVTSTKTNTNSETSTMSNSLTSTPGGNTTSTLGTESMPRWILTILIPVICGLFLLIIIATTVCHRYHRRYDEEPIMGKQEMNVKTANNDVELVRLENEHVDNSKKDLHQTHENENKSPNEECSRQKPSKREGKANIRVVSEGGDCNEVSFDDTPGSERESLSKKDGLSIELNRNPDKYQVSSKSEDVLKEDKYCADIEDNEGSSEENGLQIPRSGGNDNCYSDVSLHSEKESSEQTENPVYTQPTKHIYSNLSAKWKLKTNAESSATSETQNVDDNHEDCSYYDNADVNANKSTNVEEETLDTDYDHLDFDRELNMDCRRRHAEEPIMDDQEMNEKIPNNDAELVRFQNEHVDNSKKDLHQTHENENKSPNKECSKPKVSKREGKASIRVVSERGDYDEVLLDGTPGSECESLSEKGGTHIEINRNPDKYQVSAKSKDVLKEDKYYADIEDNEGSSEENDLQIPRSGGNDNCYSDVSLHSENESSEQTENPVHTQPTKHVYSNLSAKWKLKTNAESSATSENQNIDDNHEDCSYYDYADVNANKSTNVEDETFDTAYDHLDFDRELKMGPLRDFTSRPLSDEGENDNDSNSCREEKNTVGARDLYSKLSVRRKHDPEVDKDISGDVLERDDSNRKVAEQEKVMVETDANVYYNIDKSKDSSKSPDNELNAKSENKTVEIQTLNGFAISSQKQDTGTPNTFKEPNSASGKVNFDKINVENMQNAAGSSPSRSVKNDGGKTKGGEMLKIGSKFRIKETSYEEVNPTKCQGSAKPQKSNSSEYEEVEVVLG